MIRRRFLISGAAYIAWSPRAHAADAARTFRLAIVHPSRPVAGIGKQAGPPFDQLFLELERLGFVEDQNLQIERYSGEGSTEQLPEVARKAAASTPDVIFAISGRTVILIRQNTSTVPIVGMMSDPVSYGLTTSLSHPGGNLTGVIVDSGIATWAKRLQLLQEAVPAARRIFHVAPRTSWDSAVGAGVQAAAQRAGLTLIGPPVESPHQDVEYRRAFAGAGGKADACIVNSAPENMSARETIARLACEYKLLAMCPYREFVLAGGAMSYDIDLSDLHLYAAHQIADILKGSHPSNMAFYQPRKFRLVINAGVLEGFGVQISPSLLGRADEVVD